MIRLQQVSVSFGRGSAAVEVLKSVDLDLEAGRTLAVLGPSGAGKSTLLAIVAGLERASAGRVEIAGQDLGRLDEDGLARLRARHIGIVFQAFHLIPTLTARENVALPLELAGAADADERARAALERVGLGHRLDHYPAALSGGEQQRVAFARAVVHRPSLLLADEPTGNLDRATARLISDALFGYRDETGAAVMVITHDEALARRADRVVRIEDGRLSEAAGLPAEAPA
ncbi:ABC transporter ATP-binding protein [Tistrella mobilis]|jgi:putative ABC transport system ATP-binding protein|uniref:ABC transporter ATP-binding protein n=1 Tax=Tistrella mobilis TaxID=171437 RepID=UPI003558C126